MNQLNQNTCKESVCLEKCPSSNESFQNFLIKEIREHPSLKGILTAFNSIRINKGDQKNQNFRDNFSNRQLGYKIQFNNNQAHNISLLGFYNIVLIPEFQTSFGTLEILYYLLSAKINLKEIQNVKLKNLIEPEIKANFSDTWILALWQNNDYYKLINFFNNLVDIGSSYEQIEQIFHNLNIILKLLQLYCMKEDTRKFKDDIFDIESSDILNASFSTIDSLPQFYDYQITKDEFFQQILGNLFKNQSDPLIKQNAIIFCQKVFSNRVTGQYANTVTQNRIQGLTTYLYRITTNLIEDIIDVFLSNKYQILKENPIQQNFLYIHLPDYDQDEKQQNLSFQLLMDCLSNEILKTLSLTKGILQVEQSTQQPKKQQLQQQGQSAMITKTPFEIFIQENSLNKERFQNMFGQQLDKNFDSGFIKTKFQWHQNPIIYRIQGLFQLQKFDITPNEKEQVLHSQQKISQKSQNKDVVNMLALVKQQYEQLKQFQKFQEQEIIVFNIPNNLGTYFQYQA